MAWVGAATGNGVATYPAGAQSGRRRAVSRRPMMVFAHVHGHGNAGEPVALDHR